MVDSTLFDTLRYEAGGAPLGSVADELHIYLITAFVFPV